MVALLYMISYTYGYVPYTLAHSHKVKNDLLDACQSLQRLVLSRDANSYIESSFTSVTMLPYINSRQPAWVQ